MYREWKKIELYWFGHVQRMEENRIVLVWACTENGRKYNSQKSIYMNLESTIPRSRPTNGWQDEVREDGRIAGAEEWQEKVYNREEWKKLLRTARNCCILHMAME
jgi:hypothetical protein